MMLEWAAIWLLLAGVAGVIASNRGAAGFWYFVLALFIGPLGILVALCEGKSCPSCRKRIHKAATVCPNCSRDIVDTKGARELTGISSKAQREST